MLNGALAAGVAFFFQPAETHSRVGYAISQQPVQETRVATQQGCRRLPPLGCVLLCILVRSYAEVQIPALQRKSTVFNGKVANCVGCCALSCLIAEN